MRLGHGAMMLGLRVHSGLADLGMWIEPRLASGNPDGRRIRPWLGFMVLVLLVAGLVFIGEGAFGTMQAALPHREQQP